MWLGLWLYGKPMPDDQPPVPSSEHQSFKFNDQVMATAFLCSHERDINSLPSGKVQLAMHLVLNFFCLDARCRPPAGLFFFFWSLRKCQAGASGPWGRHGSLVPGQEKQMFHSLGTTRRLQNLMSLRTIDLQGRPLSQELQFLTYWTVQLQTPQWLLCLLKHKFPGSRLAPGKGSP